MTTITRTPYNALLDDDGTNERGTPWDKAQIKGVILDPIDVALATLDTKDAALDAKDVDLQAQITAGGGGRPTARASTVTGTVTDWLPVGMTKHTFVEWAGASDVTINTINAAVGAGAMFRVRN